MSKCAIVNRECPRTADPAISKVYCPAWIDGMVETNERGEQRVVSACSFRMIPLWFGNAFKPVTVTAGELSAMRTGVVRAIMDRTGRQVDGRTLREIPVEVGDG